MTTPPPPPGKLAWRHIPPSSCLLPARARVLPPHGWGAWLPLPNFLPAHPKGLPPPRAHPFGELDHPPHFFASWATHTVGKHLPISSSWGGPGATPPHRHWKAHAGSCYKDGPSPATIWRDPKTCLGVPKINVAAEGSKALNTCFKVSPTSLAATTLHLVALRCFVCLYYQRIDTAPRDRSYAAEEHLISQSAPQAANKWKQPAASKKF